MTTQAIVVFCMEEVGHFTLLRPLLTDFAQRGFAVHVFTHWRFASEVERAGGTLVDLFGKYPLERADSESVPIPCRYVSFAATYAEEILEELKRIRPAFVLYETFSVIGHVAARLLGVPFINVSPGHNLDPARYLPILHADPRVAISERCHRAVETLRMRYGLGDASPFSYITGLSPYLNICPQPSAFLTENERKVFEPVAFYGCISSAANSIGPSPVEAAYFNDTQGGSKIYACFGTAAPRYYADTVFGVFQAVSECLESMPEARALISLGGASLGDEPLRQLKRPNVKVVEYADQWSALGAADVFLTHHGINSTHEAIIHRVPMLSYPFFTDQPALAERCRQFGIAIPLAKSPRSAVTAENIRVGLQQVLENRASLNCNLERVRDWEQEVMAHRNTVLQMIQGLV